MRDKRQDKSFSEYYAKWSKIIYFQICNKRFETPTTLRTHSYSHDVRKRDLEDHACNICDKKFMKKSTLNQHMVVHTGTINNVKCDICNKTFTRLTSMNRHIKKSHKTSVKDKESLMCDVCGQSCKGIKELSQHVMTLV